ncbi:hypothetical protein [Terracoccus sp. 273MFTsu3.1]|uniref:hypothetical protein n=1 Tax=Terracoccus sp. 273MFTsu3.1 TaxID=1172188 RepID=UPI000380204E|nr:hypothetical protein [Terracoccus sp. 273MFTsu3.1]
MFNPTQSAQDKLLSEQASAEMFGRNVAALVEKGSDLSSVLVTVAEYVAEADEPTIGEANRYLYRWLRGE